MTTPSASNPGLPPHRTVRVDLGPRAYDVVIGRGLMEKITPLFQSYKIGGPYSVINDVYLRYWSDIIQKQLTTVSSGEVGLSSVSSGEDSKSMTRVNGLLSRLADQKISRSGTILALGGGVIGDLAGFVAAIYLRGI